jgi:hypothetical protein
MNKNRIIILIALNFLLLNVCAQTVRYSTSWFGPNANPSPAFTDARVPEKTTFHLMYDYYFGFGDKTRNANLSIEIPLLPERVSIKVWSAFLENYKVTDELSILREMNGATSGKAFGNVCVQTRISFLKERKFAPAIIFNSTLITASGSGFHERRYFDTPGYYFDFEVGKSINTNSKFISEIRGVANLGFMCWETTGSEQDDAPMYGGKIILGNPKWKIENTLSGYWGWMHTNPRWVEYGDAPLVYSTKLSLLIGNIGYFAQYQFGITDYPYYQVRVGLNFAINKLTPKYKNLLQDTPSID